MSKNPAVLFYTSDFLSGTYTMTNEQVGMYIRLLCIQHQKGKLSEKDMLAICPSRDEEVWQKFELIDGFYYNKRMSEEAEKRTNFVQKQKDIANKRWKSGNATAMPRHCLLENENENENTNENNIEIGNWNFTKTSFLNSEQWMYQFCTAKFVSRETLILKMNEFLTDIELRNEYKELKELQRHFTNWFNKSEKLKKNAKPSKNQSRDDLVESLRQKHAGNYLG